MKLRPPRTERGVCMLPWRLPRAEGRPCRGTPILALLERLYGGSLAIGLSFRMRWFLWSET